MSELASERTSQSEQASEPPSQSELAAEPLSPRDTAALRKRARGAVARSSTGDRSLAIVLGLVLLACGTLVALLANGVFGAGRAARPLLDPMIVATIEAQPIAARLIAIGAGLVLLIVGVWWAARSVRPERRPDLTLEGGDATSIVVNSTAVADAVAARAAGVPGIGRARARLVGDVGAPALRITLWLADDVDVRTVLARLHDEVLGEARESLGLQALPTAVRLELENPVSGPRVA